MRKSPTSQTEKALTAYVQGNQADTPLETVNVYAVGLAGPQNTIPVDPPTLQPAASAPVLAPPYLIFTASNPEQLGYDSGLYEMKVTARLATEIYDESVTDTEDVHRERIEALRDMLEDVPLLQSYVNPPVGTDNRTVQSFTLSALVYEDDATKQDGNTLETELYYYVCASPADS